MSKLNRWEGASAAGYRFWCPGCNESHQVQTEGAPGTRYSGSVWGFNGSLDRPTFTPSVLERSGHYCYDTPQDTCWCTYKAAQIAKGEDPSCPTCYRCHSFVTDGRIQFLDDCSHALRGWHELPDYPIHR